MAVYDLEEQEQLDDLKAWWTQWGNTIVGVVIAVCLRDRRRAGLALVDRAAGRAKPRCSTAPSALRCARTTIGEGARTRWRSSPTSSPAPPTRRARRCSTRQAAGTRATRRARRRSSHWVIDRASEDELKQIARFRLAEIAARRQAVRRGAADARREARRRRSRDSTRTCAATRSPPRAAHAEARAAYQTALAQLDPKSPYRSYVQVKLDARRRRGCRAGAASGAKASAAPAAATAAPAPAPASTRRARARHASEVTRPRRPRMIRSCAALAALPLGLRAAGCCDDAVVVACDPDDAGAVVRLAARQAATKPGPLPELTATSTPQVVWQVDVGKARAGPRARDHGRTRSTPRRDGTLVRIDPASGRDGLAHRRRQASCRRPPARTTTLVVVGTDKGDVLAFDHRRQAAVDRAKVVERGDRAAARSPKASSSCSSGDGRIFGSRRRRRQDEVGVPAQQSAAHRAQHRGRRHRRAAACSSARPADAAGARPADRQRSAGTATSPRRRARPSSSASPTSRACPCVEERQACAVAYQGRVACFDIVRGTLAWSRDMSSLDRHRRRCAATSTSPTTTARSTRSTRRPARRLWKQDKLAQRRPAVRRWSAS